MDGQSLKVAWFLPVINFSIKTMRRYYAIFISVVAVLAFFTSCSRQVSGISSVSRMETATVQQKQLIVPASTQCADTIQVTKEDIIQTPAVADLRNQSKNTIPSIQKGKTIINFVKQEEKIVVKATVQYVNSPA